MHGLLDLAGLTLCLGAAASLCSYWLRRRLIAAFARRVTRNCRLQRDAVFALASAIFTDVKRMVPDPVFITPLLATLGASPVAVLEKGGCCSGTHRLFITALDTIGIRGAQITVFRQSHPALAHCLAQVTTATENLLIDVDYGVWYRHPVSGTMDLSALRAGVTPVIEQFARGEARYSNSSRTRTAGYPDNEYYRFDFNLTRTANWADAPWKPPLHFVLHRLTQGRVDYMLLPPLLEWPEVLLSVAAASLGLLLLGVGSLVALM